MNQPATYSLAYRRTIMYITKYLFHKTYMFGYVRDIKVIFKFDLSTV